MKTRFFVILIILLSTVNLTIAQQKAVVYISSKDCLKCTAGLLQVISYCEQNLVEELRVVTDYRSNRTKILRDFPELQASVVTVDKSILMEMVPDNRSAFYLTDSEGATQKILLTEAHQLKQILSRPEVLEPSEHYVFKDSLFESGNYRAIADGDKIALFNSPLQRFLFIDGSGDKWSHYYKNTNISAEYYNQLKTTIAEKKSFDLLDYDSARILNARIRMPVNNTTAFWLDNDHLLQFNTVYFYIHEGGGNLGNRGFVFVEKFPLSESSDLSPDYSILLEPFTFEDTIAASLFTFYNQQKVATNSYFGYINLLNDEEGRNKISNKHFGALYSVYSDRVKLDQVFKLGEISLPDSVQVTLKKYSFGNNPRYFIHQGEHFIFYRNLASMLNLTTGEYMSLAGFVENYMEQQISIDFAYVSDFLCEKNEMKFVYYDKNKRGKLFLTTIKADCSPSEQIIDHAGNVDYLQLQSDKILIVRKNEEEGVIEVSKYIH